MTDWDLLTPGIGLTSIGIVGVGISLSGIAKTFIDGMHAVSLLTMFIGMIFLASGLFKDGFPSSGRAKSATFITLGFLVTFGVAAAVTASVQVPSIFAYIGLMMLIGIPSAVLAVASFRQVPYLKALAVIFIGAAVVGGSTFYAFGLVAPRPPQPAEEEPKTNATQTEAPPANIVNATILAGASAQGNPDFDPDPLTVKKGDGVSWTNKDNVAHTVTSKTQGAFDSSIINAGASWVLNTAKLDANNYDYYCTLHPHMTGLLKVSGSAAPSGGAQQNATGGANATGSTSGNQSSSAAGNQSSGGASNATAGSNSSGGGGATTTVSIVVGASVATNNEFFKPATVQTSVGSMVTWKNDDSTLHTVTSGTVDNGKPAPDKKFDSGYLKSGDSFPFVFDTAGEYPYYCSVHPYMTGKVIVK
jgi:plastocyanin